METVETVEIVKVWRPWKCGDRGEVETVERYVECRNDDTDWGRPRSLRLKKEESSRVYETRGV